ncbi:hypothetical protein [Reinekea thalattae]|uniref:DUF3551 domain-containing protein n=1 Tax=Reinekea thalattae TaxID=2593301 RepID=A0A5C8ZDK2_9GAMM|nr:hypothetical protein [Reinekea thalattae]TXR54870.1 hypothetical protein FME95_10150 [Reinekea thalattae]
MAILLNKKASLRYVFFILIGCISRQAVAHGGPLNEQAVQACIAKTVSENCQYQGHHNDLYIGTCQYLTEQSLMCVRNKPIQTIAPETSTEPEGEHAEAH